MTTKKQLERTLDYYRQSALMLAIELDAVRAQRDAYKAELVRRLTRGVFGTHLWQCIVCGARNESIDEIVHRTDCVCTEREQSIT